MAFYGSASANLSPILFKGNLFSDGVNIIMHSDVSLSMSVPSPISAASTNYTIAPRTSGNFDNFAANYRNSPFYDGIFPAYLQQNLIKNKVGDSSRSPNLYSYFDSTPRRIVEVDGSELLTKQSFIENTENYIFSDSAIIAKDTSIDSSGPNLGNLKNTKTFYEFWKNRYVDQHFRFGSSSFTSTYPFNVAAFNSRLSGVNNVQSSISLYDSTTNTNSARLSYYSEDIQGNILSIYYSGISSTSTIKTSGTELFEGDITKSVIGADLYKIPRRRLPTYLITASNEQDNAAADISSTVFQARSNVGYSTDKYAFSSQGLYARRYRGCVGNINWNIQADKQGNDYASGSEVYKQWINENAVPLPFGNVTSGIGEDVCGINWFNDGRSVTSNASVTGDVKFTLDIGGTPKVLYYTQVGNSYNYDAAYPTNTENQDQEFLSAYVPPFLKTLSNYDVNFNPAATGTTDGLVQRTITDRNRYGGFWGPFNAIDRIRSDIQNYTMMIIGYFRPPVSGIYKFKLTNCGTCAIWISSDARLIPSGSTWTTVSSVLNDDDVYSGWTGPLTATLASPGSSADRFVASNPGTGSDVIAAWNDVYGSSPQIVSDYLEMTGGRYYPIRIILSNPGSETITTADNNGFALPNSSGQLNCDGTALSGQNNPSFLRLLVSNPKTKPSSTQSLPTIADTEWNLGSINGTPIFYGGLDVWKYGSPFFQLPIDPINKTIKSEIVERNLRVISLSSYDSDDNYDGVFFLKSPSTNEADQLYRYITLYGDDYRKNDTSIPPLDSNWRFGKYFTPITYSISNPTIVTGSGSELSLNVTRLNDRYLTSVSSGGVGFKTGDRIRVSNTSLGGNNTLNDLLLTVSNVVSKSYNRSGNIEGTTRTDFPSFFIWKNRDGNSVADYSVEINTLDAGSDYSPGDRLVISGNNLDGTSVNDINIKVDTVGAGGTITGITFIDGATNYGSPTNKIQYTVDLSEFNPIGYSSISFDYKACTIGYAFNNISGAAYTTASISGISYTTLPVTGAAYSSFTITGIAYTTGNIVSIGYSAANIVSIAYTSRNITSIGYSAVNITGIAYTNADIVSMGYDSTSVTAIGYTSPSVVSIGYTAFEVDNIEYPEAITITNIINTTGGSDDNVEVTLSNVPDLETNPIVAVDGFVIISGSGDSRVDGRRRVVNIVDANTLEIEPSSPISTLNISNPPFAKLIVEDDNILGGPVGYGSTALLTTKTDHTFNVGDSIIVRGIKNPAYTDWNFIFTVQAVDNSTSIWLENTGTVGLFTATSLGQEVGAGLTVGYNQSELQLEIATPVPYQFEVGMGITVFGVTGQSAIYNNGYVIKSILESDGSGPYKFDLLQDQTPTELALPGSTGRVGIHTISGIATVSSTSIFGNPGDSVDLKIQNSPSPFFNKVFNGAVILDESRILLGADSYRNLNTPNPQEYVDINTDASTISGKIGSPLKVVYENLTPGYTFNNNDTIDVYNASESVYNISPSFYTINSILGSTLTLNRISDSNTNFSLVASSGKIGVRNLPPIITTSTVSGLSTVFGSIGQNIQFGIKDSLKQNLNSNLITWGGRIISSNQILMTVIGAANPLDQGSNYDEVGAGGTVGLSGAKLRIRTSLDHGFVIGNSVRLQNIVDQNSNPVYNGIYTVDKIVNLNTFELNTTWDPSTTFDRVGTSGLVGLRANAVVTTSSNHPFVNGNEVKIQNTSNSDFDNKTYFVQIIDSTKFTLQSTSGDPYTDDFTTAGASNGIVGLLNYPATVQYNSSYVFKTNDRVSIANTTKTYGTLNGRYTITRVDDTRFTLGVLADSSTDISSNDTSGLIGLMDAKPVVTYITNHLGNINTDLKINTNDTIRIQSTGINKFDGSGLTFTVSVIANGDPNGTFSISGNNIENSFASLSQPDFTSFTGSAVGGLIGSRLRIRSVNHNLSSTGTVRIQGTQGNQFDGNSTYTVFDSNNIDLTNNSSNSSTDFTRTETSSSLARLGPHGYPAIATFTSSLPSSFTTNSRVKIEGSTVGFDTNRLYTINRYDNNRVGLAESVIGNIYPTDITRIETGPPLYAGLVDSPVRLIVSDTSIFGTVGSIVRVNVSGMNNFFNGTQDARISSSNILELIDRTNPHQVSIQYDLVNIDTTGVVGLANAFRIVTVPSGHNLGSTGNLNVGGSIYIRSSIPGTINPISYDGRFTIRSILDTNRFAIDQTSSSTSTQNPGDYTIVDTNAYYVGVNSGARVTTSSNHLLRTNDTVTLSDNQSVFPSQNYTVRTVYSPTNFSLNNTYPTSNENTFNFKQTSTSGSITPNRPTGSNTARLKVNRILNTSTGAGEYLLPGTTSSIDFVSVAGNNYRVGQRFLIQGGLLGGSSPTNNLTITIGSVSNLGEIVYVNGDTSGLGTLPTYQGTADNTLDYSLNGSLIPIESNDSVGGGLGAQFNIVRSGTRTPTGIPTYSSVTIANGGNNYIQNNTIKISGDLLEGVTPLNDLYIKILSVNSSGTINGIAITGIASDSYAVAGFTTNYYDGTNNISRPYGLERTGDFGSSASPSLPPTQGAYLEQRQDMLSLAQENFGGVVKIGKVYSVGNPEKSASITSLFVYGNMWFSENSNDSEYNFDKVTNTGICTIYLDDDNDDGLPFRNISVLDRVFIYDSGSPYLDYSSVGYAHTVIQVNTVGGNATGTRDFIAINTKNYNATASDDRGVGSGGSPTNLKIIKTNNPLIVHAPNHGFSNNEKVIIGITTNALGLPYETTTGLGNTTYTITNINTNTFEVMNEFGVQIQAGSLLNGSTTPLVNYWYDFIRGTDIGLNGEVQGDVGTNTNDGNRSPFAQIILAKGGRASVVGTGVTPVDNRIGLAKAIAEFIIDTI